MSPRLLAANRANALKSTGPRTSAGKARSARNHTTFGFYTRGLIPLPESLLDGALRRASAAAAEYPHDPVLAQLASEYMLLAARHTWLVHNVDAFARWMFSAADPLAWVRRHGAFLRGVLHALSHLRGLLRAAEREILPLMADYHRRFDPPRPLVRAAAASAGRIEPVAGGACLPQDRPPRRRGFGEVARLGEAGQVCRPASPRRGSPVCGEGWKSSALFPSSASARRFEPVSPSPPRHQNPESPRPPADPPDLCRRGKPSRRRHRGGRRPPPPPHPAVRRGPLSGKAASPG